MFTKILCLGSCIIIVLYEYTLIQVHEYANILEHAYAHGHALIHISTHINDNVKYVNIA